MLKKIKNKKYLIFDFDKTVAKLEIDWGRWHDGVKEIFLKYDPDKDLSGVEWVDTMVNEFIERFGAKIREELWAFNAAYERDNTTGLTPNQEIIDFIKEDEDYIKYLFTSNSRPTIDTGLRDLQLGDDFQLVISRDDVDFIKPHVDGFTKIYNGEDKSLYLMIGDSASDRGLAENAGIEFEKISYPFDRAD